MVTATQYLGEQQDLISNMNKHQKNVNNVVEDIARAIMYIKKVIFKEKVADDLTFTITNDDSFMISIEDQKAEFRQDISMGIRSKTEYRRKFFGEDENTARRKIAEANDEDAIAIDDETEE